MELAAAPEVWRWGRASAMVTQAASSKSHRQGPLEKGCGGQVGGPRTSPIRKDGGGARDRPGVGAGGWTPAHEVPLSLSGTCVTGEQLPHPAACRRRDRPCPRTVASETLQPVLGPLSLPQG